METHPCLCHGGFSSRPLLCGPPATSLPWCARTGSLPLRREKPPCRRTPSPIPRKRALANLALGIAAFEQKDYPSAIASLKRASVPQIADYVAYYLAAARVEAKDLEGVPGELAATHNTRDSVAARRKAWVLEGRALGRRWRPRPARALCRVAAARRRPRAGRGIPDRGRPAACGRVLSARLLSVHLG